MMLAYQDGHEVVFEQYRRSLSRDTLSAENQALYHLFAGEGLYRFNHLDQASAECELALEIAEGVKLHALVHRADTVLAAIARREAAPEVSPELTEAPAAITHVVAAVRRLREAAVLAGTT
jgi:hypothetical protein